MFFGLVEEDGRLIDLSRRNSLNEFCNDFMMAPYMYSKIIIIIIIKHFYIKMHKIW